MTDGPLQPEKERCRCTAQGGGVYDAECPLHAGEQERLVATQQAEKVRTRKGAWLVNLCIDLIEWSPGSDLGFRAYRALGAEARKVGAAYHAEHVTPPGSTGR